MFYIAILSGLIKMKKFVNYKLRYLLSYQFWPLTKYQRWACFWLVYRPIILTLIIWIALCKNKNMWLKLANISTNCWPRTPRTYLISKRKISLWLYILQQVTRFPELHYVGDYQISTRINVLYCIACRWLNIALS